ncbi:hypothetical protein F4820DRAFT_468617 [Hypoxylon rubiginosum]|uniref:Uncharacterized protein n=1 Tax=Hypoxylon rubiginosum TaxID=110542 RepID=A0ACB9Z5I2_9PEZI|nr:hypothetical protein F4820DRAFT_468617 [Hypoxylon rubiginosum]
MEAVQQRVFGIAELLEQILLNLEARDLLVNAQRVSRTWKATIDRSTVVQKILFKLGSSKSPTAARYEKNLIIANALPNIGGFPFPNDLYSPEDLYRHNPDYIRFSNFAFNILSGGFGPVWLEEAASWRGMHIAQPPITTLRWHVQRDDEPFHELELPGITVEFKFPQGLRMGDYYDLLLGTTCQKWLHTIFWPEGRLSHPLHTTIMPVDQWYTQRSIAADRDGAIFVEESVNGTPMAAEKRDRVWNPTNLEKYLENLVKFEKLEMVGSGRTPWSYVTHDLDGPGRLRAMRMFLRAAQTPIRFVEGSKTEVEPYVH